MASITVKSTYSLDVESVRALENMARRWGVTKSEALRRAIRAVGRDPGASEGLAALDALQRSLGLDPRAAARWEKQARAERKMSSVRREPR